MGCGRAGAGTRAALVAAALAFAGCTKHVPPPDTNAQAAEYRIGREDVVEVSVWHDADLSRTMPVRPDGKISLPLLGELQAQGKTAPELASEIQQKLTPWVEKPKVSVIVREINAPRFSVIGEVVKPGIYPLRGRITVLQALAQAGGFNPFADQDGIVIVRERGSKIERYTVSYSDLVADQGAAVFLDAGDTLYVP
jgi:polysaccharide export outer membrane protein